MKELVPPLGADSMSLQEFSEKFSYYSKRILNLFLQFIKDIPILIRDFKAGFIIIFVWIFVGEISGYSILTLFQSIIRLVLYPLNWFLYKTKFGLTEIPEVFILLMPLVLLITVGFLIIISTED